MIYALHGAVGEASDWNVLAKDLRTTGHALARVDLWQYLACCPMPISEFGAKFNREINAKKPCLIGYSMGGRLALHAILDNPGLWAKAVIISTDTGMTDERTKLERCARDTEWAALALRGDWDLFIEQWNSQPVLAGIDMPNRDKLKHRREQVARSFMDWSLGQQRDLLPQLKRITCPVLWVVGAEDEKFIKIAQRVVDVLPMVELAVIKGAGHRVPWDAPHEFALRVQQFLNNEVVQTDS